MRDQPIKTCEVCGVELTTRYRRTFRNGVFINTCKKHKPDDTPTIHLYDPRAALDSLQLDSLHLVLQSLNSKLISKSLEFQIDIHHNPVMTIDRLQ